MQVNRSHCSISPLASTAGWLLNFCRLLRDDGYEWPSNEPLLFDGSAFKDDYPEEAIHVFLSAVLRSGKGRSMILRNVELSTRSRTELEKILKSNLDLHSLTLYRISSCASTGTGEQPSSSAPSEIPNRDFLLAAGNRVQALTIDRCTMDAQTAAVLCDAIRSCQNLEHLKLNNVTLSEDCVVIEDGIAKASIMESLEFYHVRMGSSVIFRLLQVLHRCVNLKRLILVGCGIGREHASLLAHLVANSNHLTELDIGENHLDANCLETLIQEGLSNHLALTKLVLSSNPIGDEGATHLACLLSTPKSQLKSLSIVDCDIWAPGCKVLAESLRHFVSLKEFIVGGEWEDHLETVIQSMHFNMVLTRFWMPQSPILLHYGNPCTTRLNYFLTLNLGKRRAIVETTLSLALWPHILEWSATRLKGNEAAEVIYQLLRQRPDILESSFPTSSHGLYTF